MNAIGARICLESEREWPDNQAELNLDQAFERVDQAIAVSTIYCANRIEVKAIAALTETGGTTLWMSRIRTDIPIFAMSGITATLRKVALYRGVQPIAFDLRSIDYTEVTAGILEQLLKRGVVENGDKVIITKGDLIGHTGGTNGMKIVTVGDFVEHVV